VLGPPVLRLPLRSTEIRGVVGLWGLWMGGALAPSRGTAEVHLSVCHPGWSAEASARRSQFVHLPLESGTVALHEACSAPVRSLPPMQ
jgi:hypothetical protein